ncbi:Asi2p NDAI_0F03110 [Naumovozyma dairenensis CBS 421]|uniref:Uncharacterized protein n=1 Tax=Naumovozyma dairenensis (strain ATCC 10597 / BCRC 20456 / CBS 421 / NBRC 0211 / NRRL Y-12639) TaxID=1071378 RepID=G0WCW8_NAUDC|nr:hypothetical protein NDAI_0F03110 [Naumovozyma dairenensis CBS 421]CCD25629.1 hypothetical protein NDAI_0F03110 [Naumovozyma dairenensis CBS 421]
MTEVPIENVEKQEEEVLTDKNIKDNNLINDDDDDDEYLYKEFLLESNIRLAREQERERILKEMHQADEEYRLFREETRNLFSPIRQGFDEERDEDLVGSEALRVPLRQVMENGTLRAQLQVMDEILQDLRNDEENMLHRNGNGNGNQNRNRDGNANFNGNNNNNNAVPNGNNNNNNAGFIIIRFARAVFTFNRYMMMMLLPLFTYNIFQAGFGSVAFSQDDLIREILGYLAIANAEYILDLGGGGTRMANARNAVAGAMNNATNVSSISNAANYTEVIQSYILVDLRGGLSLLEKFHNIVVYYSSPVKMLLEGKISSIAAGNYNFFTQRMWILMYSIYVTLVKFTTTTIYLVYGFVGTGLYFLLGCFFSTALILTLWRRYRTMLRVMAHNVGLPVL